MKTVRPRHNNDDVALCFVLNLFRFQLLLLNEMDFLTLSRFLLSCQ